MTRISAITTFALALILAHPVQAQQIGPVISNNYRYIAPNLPNYGIAQGSIFIMGGAPFPMTAATASQGVPFQTTLAGVTVTVQSGGVTLQAIPYYVSPNQITAILPSKTPVGAATITVTSGATSTSATTKVVPSAFGMATLVGSGEPWSGVLAQNDNQGGQLVGETNAANPGEYLTLWGSGLGAVPGDETQYQAQTNLTNIPIEVDIGGQSATVTYHGRSIYPGLDQINVIVPPGVSGCNVSVVVTAGGAPGNIETIPVAASGRVCSDAGLLPVTAAEYQTLLRQNPLNAGAISLSSLTTANPGTAAVTSDSASAIFQRYNSQQLTAYSFLAVPSMGSCVVMNSAASPRLLLGAPLNAGRQLEVNAPSGAVPLPPQYAGNSTGVYQEAYGSSPAIVPSGGGNFTFDNASGGPDVGAFTVNLDATLTPSLNWTNRAAITALNRANGQLITWSGGKPGSYVSILGYSFAHENSPAANGDDVYTYFTCNAPLSAGQFTVPASILKSLLPSAVTRGDGLPPAGNGYLFVTTAITQRFTAPGLDLGLLFFSAGSGMSIPFN